MYIRERERERERENERKKETELYKKHIHIKQAYNQEIIYYKYI